MRYAIVRGGAGEHDAAVYLDTSNIYVPKGSDDVVWTSDLGSSAISYATPEDAAYAAEHAWGLKTWHVVGIGPDYAPIALCSYCDAQPILLDENGEGGPYCEECFESFYGRLPECERCGKYGTNVVLSYATPGDLNSPDWCDACRADHATHAPADESGYCAQCGGTA